MSGDIEEFLRKAAARRARRSAPIVIDENAQVVEAETVPESIAESVAAHMDRSSFDERAAAMAAAVASSEQLEAHVREKFDHQVGTLPASGLGGMEQQAAATHEDVSISDIGRLLRDPTSIRQAIILNEILRPPSERW